MSNPTVLPGDLVVPGAFRLTGAMSPTKLRSEVLSQVDLAEFPIPWTAWRIWDSFTTNLTTPAISDDDLGLVGGTYATGCPSIQTGDCSAVTKTRYARCVIGVPWEYVSGQTALLRFHAGMITTVSDGTATLDVQCFKCDEETLVSGSDLYAGAAVTINSLTFADIDYSLTATALYAGDLLDIRITIAIADTVATAAVIGCIGAAKFVCDVR